MTQSCVPCCISYAEKLLLSCMLLLQGSLHCFEDTHFGGGTQYVQKLLVYHGWQFMIKWRRWVS